MALDPTIVVASVGAWSTVMAVALKGAFDSRAARSQTNGQLHVPLNEIREMVADLASEVRDVKADVRDLKRVAAVRDLKRVKRGAAAVRGSKP